MEVETKSKNINFSYDLVSNLIYQPPDLNKDVSLDVMRKHYYQDLLAASCIFSFFYTYF